MSRKTTALLLPFLLLSGWLAAQQDMQYSSFMFNAFAINPANAGLQECLDGRLGYRTQWVGFESAPRTAFLNVNQRLKGKSRRKDAVFQGVGGLIEADETGPLARTSVHAAYAVHLPLNRRVRLAFGVAAGFFQYRVDATKFRAANPSDPLLSGISSDFVIPDITLGGWLYGKGWFSGLSISHITSPQVFENDLKMVPHYYLMGGKIFSGSSGFSYIPAALLKFTGNSKAALDVNFWIDYKNNFAFGAGFRNDDALIGMVKFNFLNYFSLAYAYDFTISKIAIASSNTHEITIGINACPRNKKPGYVPCAAYE